MVETKPISIGVSSLKPVVLGSGAGSVLMGSAFCGVFQARMSKPKLKESIASPAEVHMCTFSI